MPQIDVKAVEKLVDNLAGLPLHDVERLTRQAIFNDGALTEDDLKPLLAAKYQLLNRGGTLSFEADTARFAEVGGLKNLRRWILQRKAAFDGSAPELDAPKGVLLLGVQGCGKSLAARAAAGVLGVPLVRLDFGALYNKCHGESEKNLRESLTSAEALAPCVLWIDEIEKALATGDRRRRHLAPRARRLPHLAGRAARRACSSSPPPTTSPRCRRSWCARAASTRSSSSTCPRPRRASRSSAFTARSAASRCRTPTSRRWPRAAKASPAPRSSRPSSPRCTPRIRASRASDARLIAGELAATRPLSVVMAEKIAELRDWAAERTVPAD